MHSLYSKKQLLSADKQSGRQEEMFMENLNYQRYFNSGLFETKEEKVNFNNPIPIDLQQQMKYNLEETKKIGLAKKDRAMLLPEYSSKGVMTSMTKSGFLKTARERYHFHKAHKKQYAAYEAASKGSIKQAEGKQSIDELCKSIMLTSEAQKELVKIYSIDPKEEEYNLLCAEMRAYRQILHICTNTRQGNDALLKSTVSKIKECKEKISNTDYSKEKFQKINESLYEKDSLNTELTKRMYKNYSLLMKNNTLEKLTLENFSSKTMNEDERKFKLFITANTKETEENDDENIEKNETTEKIDSILDTLKLYKKEFPGADELPDDQDPQFDKKHVTIFDKPKEAFTSWIQKRIEKADSRYSMKGYQKLGKLMGLNLNPPSQYERTFLDILNLKKLAEHKDVIIGGYEYDMHNRTTMGHDLFQRYTRMEANDKEKYADVNIGEINEALSLFINEYDRAFKEKRLLEFFNGAADGKTIGEKLRSLKNYRYDKLPKDKEGHFDPILVDQAPVPKDNSLYIKHYSEYPEHTVAALNSPVQYFHEEYDALRYSNMQVEGELTFEMFIPHLKRIVLNSKAEFPDGMCTDINELGDPIPGQLVKMDDAYYHKLATAFYTLYGINEKKEDQ